MEEFESREVKFEKVLTVQEFLKYIFDGAKAILQRGVYPPAFFAVFGSRAEVYLLSTELGQVERDGVLEGLREYVGVARPKHVAYVCESVLRHTPVTDPFYHLVKSGIVDLAKLPGAKRVLNITIQDACRHWNYIHEIVTLEDKTRYPGQLVMGQDPYLPPEGVVSVPRLFYGPPPDTARADLH